MRRDGDEVAVCEGGGDQDEDCLGEEVEGEEGAVEGGFGVVPEDEGAEVVCQGGAGEEAP